MLKNLKILNGEMPLKFDSLNTIYTINVPSDENSLKLEYEIDDQDKISIYGNNLQEGLNEVVISVYNDEDLNSYYLYVYKDDDKAISTSNVINKGEREDLEMPTYVAPAIACGCFLFILLFFTFLFRKSKKCKF